MKISVLQWNVRVKEVPERVMTVIEDLNPDIACLQELTQNHYRTGFIDVPEFLAENLNYSYYYAMAQYWPTDNGKKTQGNGIFTKFPIVANHKAYVMPVNEVNFYDYSTEGRVIAFVDIKVGDVIISVATTHLSYTHELKETEAKLEEENKFLAALNNKRNSLVIAGDFNVDENSHLIKTMEERYQHVGPDYQYKTWTTKSFDHDGFRGGDLKWRLDFVFTTRDIHVINSKVINTDVSDHLPILVEIDI